MADSRHLNKLNITVFRSDSSIRNKVWHGDASAHSALKNLNFLKFKMADCRYFKI